MCHGRVIGSAGNLNLANIGFYRQLPDHIALSATALAAYATAPTRAAQMARLAA